MRLLRPLKASDERNFGMVKRVSEESASGLLQDVQYDEDAKADHGQSPEIQVEPYELGDPPEGKEEAEEEPQQVPLHRDSEADNPVEGVAGHSTPPGESLAAAPTVRRLVLVRRATMAAINHPES